MNDTKKGESIKPENFFQLNGKILRKLLDFRPYSESKLEMNL